MMFRISLLVLMFTGAAQAAEPTYWQDIRPLMRKHCTVCHREAKLNDKDISAGLALDTLDAMRKNPAVLKSGKPDESMLTTLLIEKKLTRRMPLDAEPLEKAEIETIRKWIAAGAPEGVKPKDVVETPASSSTVALRKLPVVFTSLAALPKTMTPTGALSVSMPIGPNSPIAALAIDNAGKYLASGSYGRVTIWDLNTGKPLKFLTNILGSVNDLKFTPKGDILAVAGGQPSARGDLRLFDTKEWKLLGTLGGHLDVVTSVSFNYDGTKIVSSSFDKTVRLWDVANRKVIHTYTGHSDFVYAVAFSPKGDWYATASKDRTSRVVETATGKSNLTFSGMDQEVTSVTVPGDGTQVVTSGGEPQLHWWNSTTGERIRKQAGHNIGVNELTVAGKGGLLASAGLDGTARTWDAKTGVQARSFASPGLQAFSVALDPDSKRIAVGTSDGLIRIYETAMGRLLVTCWSGNIAATDEWFVQSGDGYYMGSEGVLKQSSWLAAGKPITDAKAITATLANPAMVAKSILGDKPPDPIFGK